MNNALLGIAAAVVMLGATAAHAQDCGPRPRYAPQGQSFQTGRYELQTTQRWVQGSAYQVWVNGTCNDFSGRGRRGRGGGGRQQCTPGHYRTEYTAGHYETRQEWVWVGSQNRVPPPPPRYNQNPYQPYGARGHVAVGVY